jgi:hypothetical protein
MVGPASGRPAVEPWIRLLGFVFGLACLSAAAARARAGRNPAIADAMLALRSGDVSPVRKWLPPNREEELNEIFRRALAVRNNSAVAMDLADSYFIDAVLTEITSIASRPEP